VILNISYILGHQSTRHLKIILVLAFAFCFCSTHAQTDTIKIDNSSIVIYKNPEVPASYPGGPITMLKHLRYTGYNVRHNIQGTVVVRFIVDSTGHSHHFESTSGPESLRDDAITFLKNVKLWVPATIGGKNVNSWLEQKMNFKINNGFGGSREGWTRYVHKNLKYPPKAVEDNIQGTVIVQFIVDSTGLVHDVSAISGPDELRAEAVRLVEDSTKYFMWDVDNAEKADSWRQIPVDFDLNGPWHF
jgi:TonB family protein